MRAAVELVIVGRVDGERGGAVLHTTLSQKYLQKPQLDLKNNSFPAHVDEFVYLTGLVCTRPVLVTLNPTISVRSAICQRSIHKRTCEC